MKNIFVGIILFLLSMPARSQREAGTNLTDSVSPPVSGKKELLFSDDFGKELAAHWVTEMEDKPGSTVYTDQQKLVLDTRGGVTVWLKQQLQGNIQIEYDREIMVGGGKNDRLSDMNQFWMAEDPRNENLFTRSGKLSDYDSLRLYYTGIGGNTNKTSRFREYDGKGDRVLLGEHLDTPYLLQPNKLYHIIIVVRYPETSCWVDGRLYFSRRDPDLLREGYFGFRSTWSRQEISHFRVYRLRGDRSGK